jgi:peptide/nickel transport system ATP-binding protein
MYLGKIVEIAEVDELFTHPLHHYTYALLAAIPVPDPAAAIRASALKGEVPSALNPPRGCRFHPRCTGTLPQCSETEPPLVQIGGGRFVACHNPR